MEIATGYRRPSSFDESALLSAEGQVLTVSGSSATPVKIGIGTACDVFVSATSIGGTSPTMVVTLEGSNDVAFGTSADVESFPQIDDSVDPVTKAIAFRSEHEYLRAKWSVGGSGATFTTTISVRA